MSASVEVVWNGAIERAVVASAQRPAEPGEDKKRTASRPGPAGVPIQVVRELFQSRPGVVLTVAGISEELGASNVVICHKCCRLENQDEIVRVSPGHYRWRQA
jgi:hypothetical protein